MNRDEIPDEIRDEDQELPPTEASADPSAPGPEALRARMVADLRAEGSLRDPAVERALGVVPRHVFLPQVPLAQAYANVAIATHWENGTAVSSASQPSIVAIMLEQLHAQPGMRVFEIGAGTGYNAALLAEMVGPSGRVTTVDIDAEIVDEARAHLAAAGYERVRVVRADGGDGWPASAPFDRIELTVGASDISPAWVAQLAEGGVLVLPLWLGASDVSVAFRKRDGVLVSESLAPCGFMRLRGREGGAHLVASLPGQWRLAAEHAERIAPSVAALLSTRPRRRLWPRPGPMFFSQAFLQYLGLRGVQLITLTPEHQRKPQARLRARYGIYTEGADGPSLCLLASRLPILLIFGSAAAERAFEAATADWQRAQALPLERWRIIARPQPVAAPVPAVADTVRVARRHFVFDVTLEQPEGQDPAPGAPPDRPLG